MPLLTVVITLVCVGIVLGLLRQFGPRIYITGLILEVIFWLIVVCTALWLLNIIGVFAYFNNVPMPTLRR